MTRDQVRASLARRGRAERAPLPPPPAPVEPRRWLDRERTLQIAADVYGLSTIDLTGQSRHRKLVEARALFVWTSFSFGLLPNYSALGRFLGGRDHKTIMNLREKAEQLIAEHGAFTARAELIAAIVQTEGSLTHACH